MPLAEEAEKYILRIAKGDTILREVVLTASQWVYAAADRATDLAATPSGGGVAVAVAQISARFGPGPYRQAPVAG